MIEYVIKIDHNSCDTTLLCYNILQPRNITDKSQETCIFPFKTYKLKKDLDELINYDPFLKELQNLTLLHPGKRMDIRSKVKKKFGKHSPPRTTLAVGQAASLAAGTTASM